MVDRIMKAEMAKQGLCKKVVSVLPECFVGMAIMSGWGTPPLPSAVKSKPVDEVLRKATLRTIMNGTKVKFCGRSRRLEQAFCEVVMSLLPVMGTDMLSDQGMFLPLRIVKQRTRDSTPQATLMGLAKRESVRPPKPTQWNRSWVTSRDKVYAIARHGM